MLSAAGIGRVALLASSNRREARFERMTEFFGKHGLSPRTIGAIGEIAEELVMNALYDAPVEAGFFETAVPRTCDVDLPSERACEISYGIENGNVFVRVRDTFGALSRERLFDVLNRCKAKAVELDESRGGAGLGMWRVFSQASTLTITVIPGQVTDITIGIATKEGRKQLLAIHLFFLSNGTAEMIVPDDSDLIGQPVTLVPLRVAQIRSDASTCVAVSRPSAIAHTISEAPRRASPAQYTPGTFVAPRASTAMLPRVSSATPS
jgi:hypothetical protein